MAPTTTRDRDFLTDPTVAYSTLVDYVHGLRRGWHIILICGAVGLGAAIILNEPPRSRFEATATLEIDPHVFVGGGPGIVGVNDPGVPAEEVQAALSARAAALTSEEIDKGGHQMLSHLFVSGDDDTHVLTMALEGPDAGVRRALGVYVTKYVEMRTQEFRAALRRRLQLLGERITAIKSRIDELEVRLARHGSSTSGAAARAELETLTGLYADLVALRQNTRLNSSTVQEVRRLGGPVLHQAASFPPAGLQIVALSMSGVLVGVALVILRTSTTPGRDG
jgi:uncharacterized protein involved in exopolysaccharide biosynthesis